MDIEARTTIRRRPLSDSELTALFGHVIWRQGQLPTALRAGGKAAYWLPLLAMYTGARCSELSQLQVSDVLEDGNVPRIEVTDEGLGQQLKTHAARRAIPIHSELIRLGFLTYARTIGSGTLWPSLPLRAGKPGGLFSNYFSSLRRGLGIGPQVVFHSFRHNTARYHC